MRGKRSKQYRKLIQQYTIHFGFREPYQVIVDADFVKDTTKCKMNLQAALERTLHGTVKPLITQCSIRHLYASNSDPSVQAAIEVAKNVCERRRCGHHPDTHPQPLSTLECLSSVVDPAGTGTNKHRYCVASQEMDVRRHMRGVKGVPLIYVNRSVMILEPMPDATRRVCEGEEKGKLRDGFVRNVRAKTAGEKRKREEEEEEEGGGSGSDGEDDGETQKGGEGEKKKKKKKNYGKKEPNPLSVQKPKKRMTDEEKLEDELRQIMKKKANAKEDAPRKTVGEGDAAEKPKRKRRRRHKAAADGEADGEAGGEVGGKTGGEDAGDGGKETAAPAEAGGLAEAVEA
ncbi:Fcf1-domain-containing protein [Coniochaeta sp. 2T2.1]|nr:Fcf1-domain-containing protein [Coniochaeta sp. 2T2.1]